VVHHSALLSFSSYYNSLRKIQKEKVKVELHRLRNPIAASNEKFFSPFTDARI
jgi:hypothetical protein